MSIASPTFYCGVQCIVYSPQRREILLGRRSGTSGGEGHWAMPGGHVEKGESPVQTARRELREETGVIGEHAELHATFFTWTTETPYAHVPVVFKEIQGEPRLVEGEHFSELGFFDVANLPNPLFRPSKLALDSVGKNTGPWSQTMGASYFVKLEFVALNTEERRDAAWTLRMFVEQEQKRVTLITSWGPRNQARRQRRQYVIVGQADAMTKVRELVLRRIRKGYVVIGLSGDLSSDQIAAFLPQLDLQVVGSGLLDRLSTDAVARDLFRNGVPEQPPTPELSQPTLFE